MDSGSKFYFILEEIPKTLNENDFETFFTESND